MASNDVPPIDAATAAGELATALDERGQDYALGGAIALGFWAAPRGTVDVDLTLFLPPERPSECVWILQEIGCELVVTQALASLREDGFCQVAFRNLRVDVFLPTLPFYEDARNRRREVMLGAQRIKIWDAETLTVFKMMFFRRKDVADVEQMLRAGGRHFDRAWVRKRIEEIYGSRDPRMAEWDELNRDVET